MTNYAAMHLIIFCCRDLSHNKIQVLEEGSFSNQRVLQDLLLQNNEIKVLKDNAFEGLDNLQIL